MENEETKLRKLYDLDDNWIGVEVVERITKAQAEYRYPETFKKMKEYP